MNDLLVLPVRLASDLQDVCWLIEGIPAHPEQTRASVAAASARIIAYDFVLKACAAGEQATAPRVVVDMKPYALVTVAVPLEEVQDARAVGALTRPK